MRFESYFLWAVRAFTSSHEFTITMLLESFHAHWLRSNVALASPAPRLSPPLHYPRREIYTASTQPDLGRSSIGTKLTAA